MIQDGAFMALLMGMVFGIWTMQWWEKRRDDRKNKRKK